MDALRGFEGAVGKLLVRPLDIRCLMARGCEKGAMHDDMLNGLERCTALGRQFDLECGWGKNRLVCIRL